MSAVALVRLRGPIEIVDYVTDPATGAKGPRMFPAFDLPTASGKGHRRAKGHEHYLIPDGEVEACYAQSDVAKILKANPDTVALSQASPASLALWDGFVKAGTVTGELTGPCPFCAMVAQVQGARTEEPPAEEPVAEEVVVPLSESPESPEEGGGRRPRRRGG